MPVGLEARFQQILNEVVAISEAIRRSALVHVNNRNVNVFEKLRCQLETIRVSADTILGSFATASISDHTIDERIIDWLTGGEPRSCLVKLKEMDDMLKHNDQVSPTRVPPRPFRPAQDRLIVAMAFFDKHAGLFRFLLTPEIWNHQGTPHQPSKAPQSITRGTRHHLDVQTAQSSTNSTMRKAVCPSSENSVNSCTASYEHVVPSDLEQVVTIRYQKLDEISRWLAALDCTEKHNAILKLRQEGTCIWFPSTNAYEEWRTDGNHFLWLHGQAGCGKSILVASTIEQLKNTLRDREVLVFFYCDFQNERSTSPSEVMRSLLSQLFYHLRALGIDPGDLPSKILDEKRDGTLSLDNLDKLCDLVACTASCFFRQLIIVIDALDECSDTDALLRAVSTLNDGDARLLVTSRPHPDMMRCFEGLSSFSFESVAKHSAADIALLVTRELAPENIFRFVDSELKNEISKRLNEKAEGRFRWVQCQLDTLKRCWTVVELKEVLENLPDRLESTYERILWKIDERKTEGKLARHALAWLVVALEPLRLAQILDGFLIGAGPGKIDREIQWLRTSLLSALSSLVTHYEETDVLALSHFSVKEYLTSSMALRTYHVISHTAHVDVVRMCIRYISVMLQRESSRTTVGVLELFPMLSYVLSSGFNHISHVDQKSTVVLEVLRCLELDVRHYPSHWDRLREFREGDLRWPYPPWPSSRHDVVLYMLIAYSSPALLQSFLSTYHPLKPRLGTNPLVYAADLRKTRHAITLLDFGAEVNMPCLVPDGTHKAPPLEVAIDVDDHVLVGELLQRGCMVTTEVLSAAVCMPWCNTRVLRKLMETDEFVEWAKEIGDEKLFRGIFSSARPNAGDTREVDEDHVALARRLQEIGQDLSADGPFGAELIERALHAAHTSMLNFLLPVDQPPPPRFLLIASTGDTAETVPVVQFLLEKGVDVNVVSDGSGDTALHLATMCPWEPRSLELTQALIIAGCNPDVHNLRNEIPLTIALKRGYLSVVKDLLSRSDHLPPDVLLIGLRNHATPEMIEFLIHKDANVHCVTSDGDTIFHLAATRYNESNCLDLISVFIKAGCNPNIHNSAGKGTIEVTMICGYSSVVKYLVSCNVTAPADIPSIASGTRSTDGQWHASESTTSRCLWTSHKTQDPCFALISGNGSDIAVHLAEEHDIRSVGRTQPITCRWAECGMAMRRESVVRHIRERHLKIKATCPHCGIALSRMSVLQAHLRVCVARAHAATEATE